jgi:hypothetical protein
MVPRMRGRERWPVANCQWAVASRQGVAPSRAGVGPEAVLHEGREIGTMKARRAARFLFALRPEEDSEPAGRGEPWPRSRRTARD